MTNQNQKNAIESIRWNTNVHIQYYICFILLVYLLVRSEELKLLSFDTMFNGIVNVGLILSLLVQLFVRFIWNPDIKKVLFYSKYLLSLKEEKKKTEVIKAQHKVETTTIRSGRL